MTMRVTILSTVMGESGSLLTAGSTYSVSDAFGASLVNSGRATDTDRALSPQQSELKPYFSTDTSGNVTGLVGPVGVNIGLPTSSAGLLRTVVMGDSMTASAGSNATITSLTRSNNVVTIVCATHGRGTGEICTIYNTLDQSFSVNDVAVTRIDANTLTYPCAGTDGTTTDLVVSTKPMQLQSSAWCNDNSYMFWLQSTKCNGAMKLVRNAGRSGQNSADMLGRYTSEVVSAGAHDAVIIFTGYNDFAAVSYTADQVYANVTSMAAKSPGKLVAIIGAIPWTTGGTAANRKEALKYNRKIRNWCNAQSNVVYADAAKYIIDATNATAFSPLANMLQSDGIHPSPRGAERIAQAVYDAIQYRFNRSSRLVSCSLDTYANDSTNVNILDAAPWTNTGGALAGGTTGTAAAGIAVTLAGGAAVASCPARANGIGYDQQVVFTPSANNDSITLSGTGNISGRTADGNKLNYIGELILSGMSGANIKSVEIYLGYASSGATHYLAKAQAANASAYPSSDMTIDFASLVDSVVCAGHTGIGWGVIIKAGAAGTALTVKLGQQSIEKV